MPDTIQPELTPPTDSASPALAVPGFLVRALALSLDVIVLTILCYVLTNNAYAALYPARWTWQVLAMLIVLAYFIVGSSGLTRGQTIGKKMVGIRVVSLDDAAGSGRPGNAGPGDGASIPLGRAAARGALVFSIVTGYVLFRQMAMPPRLSLEWILPMQIAFYLCGGYAMAASFFLAMHPKKRALHDVAAGTGVVYERSPEAGVEFLRQWNAYCEQKMRPVRITTPIIGLLMAFPLVQGVTRTGQFQRALEPLRVAETSLRDGGFEPFQLVGPSEAMHRRCLESVKSYEARRKELVAQGQAEKAKRYDSLVADALRRAEGARRFQFVFQLDTIETTDTLKADPRFAATMERLPALAERLSSQFFMERFGPSGEIVETRQGQEPTTGTLRPSPYTGIETTFVEALPLFLYSKFRPVWRGEIPVTGHEPSSEPSGDGRGGQNGRSGQSGRTGQGE